MPRTLGTARRLRSRRPQLQTSRTATERLWLDSSGCTPCLQTCMPGLLCCILHWRKSVQYGSMHDNEWGNAEKA